jgi:hypothetical protein
LSVLGCWPNCPSRLEIVELEGVDSCVGGIVDAEGIDDDDGDD